MERRLFLKWLSVGGATFAVGEPLLRSMVILGTGSSNVEAELPLLMPSEQAFLKARQTTLDELNSLVSEVMVPGIVDSMWTANPTISYLKRVEFQGRVYTYEPGRGFKEGWPPYGKGV